MKEKLLSGRWILTCICGIVFAYCSIKRVIPPEAITAIMSSMFTAYFNRNDRKQTEGGTK